MLDAMNGSWRSIEADEVQAFVRETLFAPSRKLPVVAVTTSAVTRRPWIDPESLAAELGERAEVVLIETGDSTWALGAALPKRLDVFGGAVRVWWPGLTSESNPFDHLLVLIHGPSEAERARRRILAAIVQGDEGAGRWGDWKPGAREARVTGPPVVPPARVVASQPDRARHPFAPPPESIDPWQRIGEEFQIGDVVRGRVFRIDPGYVLLEIVPGASVIVPLAEIDYTWVQHPGDLLKVGEVVIAEILELDPAARRGLASIKRALHSTPSKGISMGPGEPAYLEKEDVNSRGAEVLHALRREEEKARSLGEELGAALDDRQNLAQHNEKLKQQMASVRKDLRSAEDRLRAFEHKIAGELDPLASETTFLAAVRVEHARRLDETDRFRYPLQKMRVGRAFLQSLRALEGIEPDKVIEVCAQVASGRAHEVPGRSVHELTATEIGKAILRAGDGAKAWRCSLQAGSPSARRLHWWNVPGHDGATIEFASVAVHEEFSIPH